MAHSAPRSFNCIVHWRVYVLSRGMEHCGSWAYGVRTGGCGGSSVWGGGHFSACYCYYYDIVHMKQYVLYSLI